MSCGGSTPTARATSAQPSSDGPIVEPSVHWRVVKMWPANGCRSPLTSARPAAACTHAKPPLGLGSIPHLIVMANIIGLGLDATDIDRIAATIERYGERFLHRIFTEGEVAYCMRRRVPSIHFAGRF